MPLGSLGLRRCGGERVAGLVVWIGISPFCGGGPCCNVSLPSPFTKGQGQAKARSAWRGEIESGFMPHSEQVRAQSGSGCARAVGPSRMNEGEPERPLSARRRPPNAGSVDQSALKMMTWAPDTLLTRIFPRFSTHKVSPRHCAANFGQPPMETVNVTISTAAAVTQQGSSHYFQPAAGSGCRPAGACTPRGRPGTDPYA